MFTGTITTWATCLPPLHRQSFPRPQFPDIPSWRGAAAYPFVVDLVAAMLMAAGRAHARLPIENLVLGWALIGLSIGSRALEPGPVAALAPLLFSRAGLGSSGWSGRRPRGGRLIGSAAAHTRLHDPARGRCAGATRDHDARPRGPSCSACPLPDHRHAVVAGGDGRETVGAAAAAGAVTGSCPSPIARVRRRDGDRSRPRASVPDVAAGRALGLLVMALPQLLVATGTHDVERVPGLAGGLGPASAPASGGSTSASSSRSVAAFSGGAEAAGGGPCSATFPSRSASSCQTSSGCLRGSGTTSSS